MLGKYKKAALMLLLVSCISKAMDSRLPAGVTQADVERYPVQIIGDYPHDLGVLAAVWPVVSESDQQAVLRNMVEISNNRESIEFILDRGVRPDVPESFTGSTVLHTAAMAECGASNLRVLLAYCKAHRWSIEPLDNDGITPLGLAVAERKYAQVEALLSYGAQVDLVGPRGITPLFYAVDNNDADLIALCLRYAADPYRHLSIPEKMGYEAFTGSCFKKACMQACNGDARALDCLLCEGYTSSRCLELTETEKSIVTQRRKALHLIEPCTMVLERQLKGYAARVR